MSATSSAAGSSAAAPASQGAAPRAKRSASSTRALLTVCLMTATIMQALDTTIANVALPYMQGSLSATQDQVNWVLTSYIVAAAIMTAPVGWLSGRYGRKKLFIICAAGFTAASMLCGVAQSITDMVLYRLLQGVFGAALVPLSQAVMMDIYPPEKRGQAMAIWGMGVMLGPIMGPTLGGWLTDQYSWRWVFFVNLPFGIATVLGLMAFMEESEPREGRFDWLGFGTLSIGLGALQLMLDRGETVGWFEADEVWIETIVACFGLYLFIAHSLTAERPFIPIQMFKDRNFTIGVLFMFVVGIILLATMALITPYLQNVMGYPVLSSGFLLGTRGVGTLVSMMIVGRLLQFIDARILIFLGLSAQTISIWELVWMTPETSAFTIIWTSIVQGVGLGLVFVPLNTVAFATLPVQYRTDATGVWTLIRNLGSAIGVSIVIAQLTSTTTLMHARLTELVTPWNLGLGFAAGGPLDPSTDTGKAMLDQVVTGQALVISYSNDYLLMTIVGLATFPLLLLMKGSKRSGKVDTSHAVAD